MSAKKGQWVQLHDIVLRPEERTAQLPDDTKRVPLELWVKGYLNDESAEIGAVCEITTVTGRLVSGVLCAVEPPYTHGFGSYVPELGQIRSQLKALLEEARS
jgi:hypothetical protein